MHIDRTPEEFTRYVKRMEEVAWQRVGHTDEYEALMENAKANNLTYVEALERLVLSTAQGID